MKIAIRVDASNQIGTGHVMRCLTLADELRSRGCQVQFICREHPGHMADKITGQGFQVSLLPEPEQTGETCVDQEDYAAWLGVTQEDDAKQTIAALDSENPDWLIVDHYGLDAEWEKVLRPYVDKIMVIDDLADREHDCDLLLDQNFSQEPNDRYCELVPDSCRCLLGPNFAILRNEYSQQRKFLKNHDGIVRRALIFYGGSDPENLTGLTIEAMCQRDLKCIELDVVVGANHQDIKLLEKQAASRGGTTIYRQLPHLADVMAAADLGIGAGGATTWERLCLGLPSIVVATAQNQYPACYALSNAGYIEYVGAIETVNKDKLSAKIIALMDDPKKLIDFSSRGLQLVDGLGVQRIVEFL